MSSKTNSHNFYGLSQRVTSCKIAKRRAPRRTLSDDNVEKAESYQILESIHFFSCRKVRFPLFLKVSGRHRPVKNDAAPKSRAGIEPASSDFPGPTHNHSATCSHQDRPTENGGAIRVRYSTSWLIQVNRP